MRSFGIKDATQKLLNRIGLRTRKGWGLDETKIKQCAKTRKVPHAKWQLHP